MKRTILIVAVLLSAFFVQAEHARDAWSKLVGPKAVKNAAYAYVVNNETLPNVLIYGDSISIGYTPYVRKALEGKANVYRLYSNGSDSSAVFSKMDNMRKVMRNKNLEDHWDFEWDVIHFNVGLHDLKYFKDGKLDINGEQVNPVDKYVKNLENVINYFKQYAPNAKLVFATTTPVPANSAGRKEGDARRYNEAALDLLKKYPEIVVDDLYSLTLPNQKTWWVKPGNVHFTPAGCEAQGNKVAEVISKLLPVALNVKLPPKENFYIFLMAGQSNMAGRGKIEARDMIPHPRVLVLSKEGTWKPAVAPLHYDKSAAGVCLGTSFAVTLADKFQDVTIGLVPAACGGSSIKSWVPGGYHGQTKSHPYDDAVSRTKTALEKGVLKGIIWHQGEADCSPARASEHEKELTELVARFRSDLNTPSVPFIIGQLGQFDGKPWSEGVKMVDNAQRKVAADLPGCAFVSSDGLTPNSDIVHFNSESLREFGKRYAEAYLKILNVTK